MAFERSALSSIALATLLTACAHHDLGRFPLAAPVERDPDLDDVQLECKARSSKRPACAPEPYESSFSWDAADNTIFRPVSKALQVDDYGEAPNVNALDEVPNSSWFQNRIGAGPLSPDDVFRGYCSEGPELESNPTDGSWTIDAGKDNGANPGFRVRANDAKFMFKTDDTQPERATAATAIASRLYYAAGWWAPCDSVVYFKRSALRLKPGLMIKANVGPARALDEARLDQMLSKTARRGELYRATASRFIPGVPLGPFKYEGVRADDPSDVIPHENRRDLRGARLMAAWLDHFDTREQNTMSTWMPAATGGAQDRGQVRHWYIDFGDSFGSEWSVDAFSKRHGYSYTLDFGDIVSDFATLGAVERPWDRAQRKPGFEIFGYFRAADFDAEAWKGEYPNPAFGRMTEHDAAWVARIIARFTPEHVAAAVKTGNFTNADHGRYLTQLLLERQRILLKRYFSKLSPLSDVSIGSASICVRDLARYARVLPENSFHYRASVKSTGAPARWLVVRPMAEGQVCFDLRSASPDSTLADSAIERYRIVTIDNGTGAGPLLLHLYDLGDQRGLRLTGIERPSP
ncbi:MAG TPA: hypothetical protein VNG33_19830 [Polyangiaceae bacterium]|nr:hypothetical protein [Polyangiaceae bacterium]